MALNSGALNSHALNASAGFTQATGSASVSIEQIVNATGSTVANIAQIVGTTGASSADIVQIVALRSTGTTSVSIEQIVNSTASTSVEVEQFVRDQNVVDFFTRNDYEPYVYIDNRRIAQNLIHSTIEIIFQEDQAPQAKVTLIPARGTQDIASYRGKSLKINVRTSSGVQRIYTGTINEPDIQIIEQKIVLHSSLDIEQEIENLSDSFINSVGYYNNFVFSKPRTKKQELQDRVSTIPKVIDWDRYGKIQINNIAAKATQDYTRTSSQVRRADVDYKLSSRQRYINKINIKASYTYQRLHHQEITFSANSGISTFCDFATNSYTPMRRDLVTQAANGAGWVVRDMTFGDFFDDGYYTCNGGTIGFITTSCSVSAQQNTGTTNDGNNQNKAVETSCTSTKDSLCLSASWKGSTRWSQNITQDFTLSVECPQSIAEHGEKLREETFQLSDSYEGGGWEDYSEFSDSAPDGFSKTGTSGSNFWVDTKSDFNNFNNSITVLLNRAKSEMLKSHRDDVITIKQDLWPEIQLSNTVKLNTNRIVCKGKVKSYRHVMNANTGEAYTMVDLSMSRSTGSASDDSLSLPAVSITDYDPTYPAGSVFFNANYGVDVNEQENPSGYYGNWIDRSSSAGVLTTYPVAFVAKVPAVPDNIRKTSTIPLTSSFDVSIPNDELTIIFPDDNYV